MALQSVWLTEPARDAPLQDQEAGFGGAPHRHGHKAAAEGGGIEHHRVMDSYILGLTRFQLGCSARFHDLQHVHPKELHWTTETIELQAWQTKTVSASKIRRHPVPLICPKYSFRERTNGQAWSPPLAWEALTGGPVQGHGLSDPHDQQGLQWCDFAVPPQGGRILPGHLSGHTGQQQMERL